jgi:hypothetical protein
MSERRIKAGLVSRTAEPQVGREGGALDATLVQRIEDRRGGGAPLASDTRAQMESAFGHHFGDVRVHAEPEDDALARSVGAVAFTTGSDIFLRDGAEAATTPAGNSLLAHELAHVVQQRTMSDGGPARVGAADDAFEQAAESAAAAVGQGLTPTPGASADTPGVGRVIQRCGPIPCDCPPEERAAKEAAMAPGQAHAG